MRSTTFSEWVSHFGETRLEEHIASSSECYLRFWKKRKDMTSIRMYPAWELCLGSIWQESESQWHKRWNDCDGRLINARMIAATWDPIWTRLSETFYDGLGNPYPPYSRSSCAYWRNISADEAIVLGVVSKAEYQERISQLPRTLLRDKNGKALSREALIDLKAKLAQSIREKGGLPLEATREERYHHRKQMKETMFQEARDSYVTRQKEKDRRYA